MSLSDKAKRWVVDTVIGVAVAVFGFVTWYVGKAEARGEQHQVIVGLQSTVAGHDEQLRHIPPAEDLKAACKSINQIEVKLDSVLRDNEQFKAYILRQAENANPLASTRANLPTTDTRRPAQ